MLTAEHCLRLAEECEQAAARASALKLRQDMLMVARMWRELAARKEQTKAA
jgi:hypothetical protein